MWNSTHGRRSSIASTTPIGRQRPGDDLLTGGAADDSLAQSLAGHVFRVGQRAARPFPERRPAKFRRADSICWSSAKPIRKARPDLAQFQRCWAQNALVIRWRPRNLVVRGFTNALNRSTRRRPCERMGASLGRLVCCAISVARARAALTAAIPRSSRPLAHAPISAQQKLLPRHHFHDPPPDGSHVDANNITPD